MTDTPPPTRLSFASLVVHQPADGYRFSVDSVLLADFALPFCGPAVLDLGTGSGILLLLLARRSPVLALGVGVEIQDELWACACRNAGENGLSDRLRMVRADLREWAERPQGTQGGGADAGAPKERFDLVVANPPFRRVGEGRRNPHPGREVARHEVACTMSQLFVAASRRVAPGGCFALVALASRLPELFACSAAAGIVPERLRFVHPRAGRPAGRVLFAGRSGGRRRDVEVLPPLVEYVADGVYHPDVERVFDGMLNK